MPSARVQKTLAPQFYLQLPHLLSRKLLKNRHVCLLQVKESTFTTLQKGRHYTGKIGRLPFTQSTTRGSIKYAQIILRACLVISVHGVGTASGNNAGGKPQVQDKLNYVVIVAHPACL
jgi:hypothetical protein